MTTRFLVSLLSIIPLAGTLVRSVPPPRTKLLETRKRHPARKNLLTTQLKETAKAFRAGDFRGAAALAQQGYGDALSGGEPHLAARFLGNLGGCRFVLHQYKEALQDYLEARRLAEALHENTTAGRLDLNISSLYTQLGEIEAALEAASRASALLSGKERVRVLIHTATLRAAQDRLPQAAALFGQGIEAADRSNDREMYALGWMDLGEELLKRGRLRQAEHAMLEAYRTRKLNGLRGLENCYRYLGLLRLQQGDLRAASALLDRAVEHSRQPGGMAPTWEVYYGRGRVRLGQHNLEAALDDFRVAARLARDWRREAPPDDATRVAAENAIQKVHSALVEAGNQIYFKTHRPALAQETFESAEANRAASLRALLAEPRDWRRNLPAEYWETLQRLESAEVEMLRAPAAPADGSRSTAERIQQLQGALIQWESQAHENTDREIPHLLEHTRRALRPDAAFFAFHLGSPDSYLWAVSRDQFALYRLPPGPRISGMVKRFTTAVGAGSVEAQAAGSQLFRVLFGRLDPAFQKKERWLLALDAQLFDLPLAALIVETRGQVPVFLAERHSLQLISGAAMLAPPVPDRSREPGPFVAVADPVYNMADPRWKGSQPPSLFSFFAARADESDAAGTLHLARLAGSAREVRESATAWGGPQAGILLEGPSASRDRLRQELERHPAVLHFATHIMRPHQGSRSGLIVLSLNRRGQHEVVSPVEIATWNLEGTLVSLSGCSSGSADALPGTGLMGLTRACQAAGARAVVASHWPTPDDSGALFLAFYRALRADPQAGPAAALQRAQIDMIRSGTWRSSPRYWSSYFLTGNQQ